jgi:PhzF family phenazine biosynthesis protein
MLKKDLYKFPIYQVDAFSSEIFGGNSAAIIPLSEWLPRDIMQKIANENNLAETAFFIPNDKGFQLRWFTPTMEVDLCGHATLAAAHVLWNHLDYNNPLIRFFTNSGPLDVTCFDQKLIDLILPIDIPKPVKVTTKMLSLFDEKPIEVLKGYSDYVFVFEKQSFIANYKPDFEKISKLDARGMIITAKSNTKGVDFVSRCFFPQSGINEDPVTGSAHCTLVPYWAKQIKKKRIIAQQISSRKGELICSMDSQNVTMSGTARTYLVGEIFVYL